DDQTDPTAILSRDDNLEESFVSLLDAVEPDQGQQPTPILHDFPAIRSLDGRGGNHFQSLYLGELNGHTIISSSATDEDASIVAFDGRAFLDNGGTIAVFNKHTSPLSESGHVEDQ